MKLQLQQLLSQFLTQALLDITGVSATVTIDVPKDVSRGDLTTNIALSAFAKIEKATFENPRELAETLKQNLLARNHPSIAEIKVEGAGFINIWVSQDYLLLVLTDLIGLETSKGMLEVPDSKRVMVEYAHPNTHKEMHIGHMRTLITGEAIARLYEASGAEVFRANYQGDIGLHVAKSLWGILQQIKDQRSKIKDIEERPLEERAKFLGECYVLGSKGYEQGDKEQIDEINRKLYESLTKEKNVINTSGGQENELLKLYQKTRQWSLDYYDFFYKQFYTKFDQLFFESEMVEDGVKIVKEHTPAVFALDQGAYVFKGEEYGLHTRVFVTSQGYPTYEGKDIANAYHQYEAFAFDRNIHVVASEQAEYFKVVFKALSFIDKEKFAESEYHMPMGMVQLVGKKISSRTGEVVTVDSLVLDIKKRVEELIKEGRIEKAEHKELVETITIGAIKYAILRVAVNSDVAFDLEKSVSLDGDSAPYLQYTYARTQSILNKANHQTRIFGEEKNQLSSEEKRLARYIYRFPSIISNAVLQEAPQLICTYLFELAHEFNAFYQAVPILKAEEQEKRRRLFLVGVVGNTLALGLDILGIKAPKRM